MSHYGSQQFASLEVLVLSRSELLDEAAPNLLVLAVSSLCLLDGTIEIAIFAYSPSRMGRT